MTKQQLALWFRVVTIILIGFGLLYFFFGLKIFSNNAPLIPHHVLLDWESALYGAIMLGWGVTLFLLGRIAFKRDDKELKRVLMIGLVVWLAFEAAASAWLGVWFNVGVDVVVAALFSFPLLRMPK
jgi:hypothetical protein